MQAITQYRVPGSWLLMNCTFLVLVIINALPVRGLSAADCPRILLREEATLHNRTVLLEDVAELSGASAHRRKTLAALDLAELSEGISSLVISREQVRVRLLLSGWEEQSFDLQGAAVIRIAYEAAVEWTDQRLETLLQSECTQARALSEGDLSLRLIVPFLPSLPESLRHAGNLRLEPVVPQTTALGRLPVPIRIWQGPHFVGSRLAVCDVQRRYRVAIARRPLPRLHEIMESDLSYEDRFSTHSLEAAQPGEWIGRRLNRDVATGEVIQGRMLLGASTGRPRQLVKVRDPVPVVARSGQVRVTLQAAEALQGGDPGDIIRVRNSHSNTIVSGVIQADGSVEIPLK